jgi:hypothetical protein
VETRRREKMRNTRRGDKIWRQGGQQMRETGRGTRRKDKDGREDDACEPGMTTKKGTLFLEKKIQ